MRLLDAHTFEELAVLDEQRVKPVAAASADGRVVAVATDEDSALVLDTTTGQVTQQLEGAAFDLAFSADGAVLARTGEAGGVIVRDIGEPDDRPVQPEWVSGVATLDVGEDETISVVLNAGSVVQLRQGAPGLGEQTVPCCENEAFALPVPDAEPNPLIFVAGPTST